MIPYIGGQTTFMIPFIGAHATFFIPYIGAQATFMILYIGVQATASSRCLSRLYNRGTRAGPSPHHLLLPGNPGHGEAAPGVLSRY